MLNHQRIRLIAAVSIPILLVALVLLPQRFRSSVETARMTLLSSTGPALGLISKARSGLQSLAGMVPGGSGSPRNTERLRAELSELSNEVAMLKSALADRDREIEGIMQCQRSLEELGIPELETTLARVIGRNPSGPPCRIIIDRGTIHGVAAGCGVIWRGCVVGIVSKAGRRASVVALVSAPECNIPALLVGSGENGITRGEAALSETFKLQRIHQHPPKIGEIVSTSGLLGIFPRSLIIGHVKSASERLRDLHYDITVQPSANLTSLHSVLVLLPRNEELRRLLSP